jgi:hypothetical protein
MLLICAWGAIPKAIVRPPRCSLGARSSTSPSWLPSQNGWAQYANPSLSADGPLPNHLPTTAVRIPVPGEEQVSRIGVRQRNLPAAAGGRARDHEPAEGRAVPGCRADREVGRDRRRRAMPLFPCAAARGAMASRDRVGDDHGGRGSGDRRRPERLAPALTTPGLLDQRLELLGPHRRPRRARDAHRYASPSIIRISSSCR